MKRSAGPSVWRWVAAVLLAAMTLGAQAQMGPSKVKKFRVPEFDENGKKRSEIFGEEADMLPDGKIKITGLRIVLYDKDGVVVEGTLVAADCVFDRADKSAFSNSAVSMERDRMLITGKGLRWNAAGQHIEILNDVRVQLKGVKMWDKQERP